MKREFIFEMRMRNWKEFVKVNWKGNIKGKINEFVNEIDKGNK